MGGEEIHFVNEAYNTNWIAPVGPNVDAFEKELASYTHVDNAVVLSSGTAAIHLALRLLNISPRDEILLLLLLFRASKPNYL